MTYTQAVIINMLSSKPMYLKEIVAAYHKRATPLAESTLHEALAQMVMARYIRSYRSPTPGPRGGNPRRYYDYNEKGRKAYMRFMRTLTDDS